MTLTPIDETHALQIQAGILGRKAGHEFEDKICYEINHLKYPMELTCFRGKHIFSGSPSCVLLKYIMRFYGETTLVSVSALSTGALATSEDGQKWLMVNGIKIKECKSDLVITLHFPKERTITTGVSVKQCNNPQPTNAQLYFTTVRGFVKLLTSNGKSVSDSAIIALRQFCGEAKFCPKDDPQLLKNRRTDPRRFFWEELPNNAREEWEDLFTQQQNDVTRLLFQNAYPDDPFTPDFLLHKIRRSLMWETTECAVYGLEELVHLSRSYQSFCTRPYSVRKGSYPDPEGVTHLAPRFGIVQMQRAGTKKNPSQLQFNLEAGYFFRLEEIQ